MDKINQAVLDHVTCSCLMASSTLGIKIAAPYTLPAEDGSANYLAFLQDFGGPKGMVVAALVLPEFKINIFLQETAKKKGLYFSSINPLGWVKYDEASFKEALEDWGYYGPMDKCPKWFNGFKHFATK